MKTVLPEDIKIAADEEIAALETELLAEFDELVDAGSTDVAVLNEIADAVEAIRAEQAARNEAAHAAAEAVAALTERMRPVASETNPEDEGHSEEADGADDASEETPEATEAEAETEERELVTASADKAAPKAPSARAVARRTTTPEMAKTQAEVVITAAADIPGFSGGAHIDNVGIARAMHAKARTLSNGSGMVPVASINLPIENKLGADLAYNLDVLDRVTAPSALTAAGWCAPSNNLYTLFGIDAGDGLIDLPTVQITRGGLNVPGFIGFDEAVANGGLWNWTEEDQDDAEATKPCVYIPCPSFTDYRLEAEGICVTNGNLTDRAFPELTTRYIQLVLNTHLHRVSGAIIQKIKNHSNTVYMNAVNTSAAGSILNAVDVQVADYRSKFRMSVNSVLEAVFPLWTREVMRADFAMRQGVNMTNVTDADIDAHFAVRKVRAQFVHDLQPMSNPLPPTYGNAAQAFPTNLEFLLYPAGGFVRGDGGVIDLGVVRDSVLNATNDYTAAWTEQMFLVAPLGPLARVVQVTYDVDGATGCCPMPTGPTGPTA